MFLRAVARNINILNLILTASALLFTHFTVMPLVNAKVSYTAATAKKEIKRASSEAEVKTETEPALPSPMEYAVIAEHNIFHPERKIPPLEKKEEKAALPKPEFTLYGTMVSRDISLAYMDDKKAGRSTPGRGKRQTALKKGDALSGFIVGEIRQDSVLMVRGEDKIEVKVLAQGGKRERNASESAPSAEIKPGHEQPKAFGAANSPQGVGSAIVPLPRVRTAGRRIAPQVRPPLPPGGESAESPIQRSGPGFK